MGLVDDKMGLEEENEESYVFSGDFKSLKTRLHFQFIRYLDLFIIFWLILEKRLVIHDSQSYFTLWHLLNSVTTLTIEPEDVRKGGGTNHEPADWSLMIHRFIESVRQDFGIYHTFSAINCMFIIPKTLTLTFTDFDYCNTAIKREPFGLISAIHIHNTIHNTNSCNSVNSGNKVNSVNKVNSGNKVNSVHKVNSVDMSKSLLDWVNNRVDYESRVESKSPMLGIISPFLLNTREHNRFKPVKTAGTDEGDKKWAYNINQLYPLRYPLDALFPSKHVVKSYNYSYSLRISLRLYDLVLTIFGKPMPSPFLEPLAAILKYNLDELFYGTGECPDKVKLHRRAYEHTLEKASALKPFPTIYWLMNKDLIARVSELEEKGLIKEIESTITSLFQQFHNSPNHNNEHNMSENENSPNDNNGVHKSENNNSVEDKTENNNSVEDKSEFGRLDVEKLAEMLILDNILYAFRRFQFTHPSIIEAFYSYFVNSPYFTLFQTSKPQDYEIYINFTNTRLFKLLTTGDLAKGIAVVNTLRRHGIGGSQDFLHIKCLHTHLAYDLIETSIIGSLISQLI
ncbi:hypothetical protein TpMuguga_02g00421 [Theileria parva strain Muguga]|uniref:Uncharacterized protein n=1 Tax=Theileria parva TaxID=5875 RepID=Q4N569_THEPA|nr:uncharacterized protein TpMuguga_02g00421 [Theileria parva strain Muguga]EAN32704.1 hypothetical protein TpMuguga_02g00421 [Theileria parva strain Muguga]|eukprot:XP_764987.1 hypothetical protein [Theileria parva strain Muguga]